MEAEGIAAAAIALTLIGVEAEELTEHLIGIKFYKEKLLFNFL